MEAADCETIIARLVKERFVDERRYAAAYVREKMSCSGWGRRRIEMGLRAKGIPQEYIDLVRKTVDETVKFKEIHITKASCTISCHCGPNTLGILFETK